MPYNRATALFLPPKKRKERNPMGIPRITEWIPGLPEELGLECLTRLPSSSHPTASRVCRPWRSLLQSHDFYRHRRDLAYTRNVACLVQSLPSECVDPTTTTDKSSGCPQQQNQHYGIAVFDPSSESGGGPTWERLPPIPKYPEGVPLFCGLASCEGKLVVMGGWDPATYKPVADVSIYDFTTCLWRRGKDMPSKRSFFAIGSASGRVYVAGGHDEGKNALKSAWEYDVKEDEWAELEEMGRERDECQGLVIGDEFWVVSGYGTERQGAFESGADVMGIGSGRWRRADGVWEEGQCPRACGGGVGRDGRRLVSWAEMDGAVRVGARGVELGIGSARVLVMGSEYDGANQRMFMKEEGQNGKLARVSVPEEFCGFVQSGCCVEI